MDYSGKIIRKNPVTPSQTSASGVWTLDEAMQATKNNSWPVANVPDPISRSLRFRASATAYLSRTPATATNRKTWTWSGWVKRGVLSTNQVIFSARSGSSWFSLSFDGTTNSIAISDVSGGSDITSLLTTAVYRDPSAWYHIVFVLDTTQATSSNRCKLYVNGSQVTAFSSATYPTLNFDGFINTANEHLLGQFNTTSRPLDGYMTEVNFIDGQALTPSSFGGTNAVTGVWEPRAYTGTYGTNGFYVNFKDNTSTTTLGYDYSGNSNNWTTNNISLTAGSTYDSMLDVPTQWIGYNTGDVASVTRGNYATFNPILYMGTGSTKSNGNLTFAGGGTGGPPYNYSIYSTFTQNTGKWYWEVTITTAGSQPFVGMFNTAINFTGTSLQGSAGPVLYGYDGNYYNETSGVAFGATYTTGDVIGVAVDYDNNLIWFSKNGTFQNSGVPATGTNGKTFGSGKTWGTGYVESGSSVSASTFNINFGQRPFSYTPPAGFVSLCTTNLPSPTILQGNQYFDATLYTGTGSTLAVTNTAGFQPDWVWLKNRSSSAFHSLWDAVRGRSAGGLATNDTMAEQSSTAGNDFVSFNSNGFSVGPNQNWNVDTNTASYVAWQWKASGSTVSNTAGSITSTVSANQTAGFSIVTYTGNGTGGATVGHGLGVAPKMLIVKNRVQGTYGNWNVWHTALSGSQYLTMNDTSGASTNNNRWNGTIPTSTVFSLGADSFGNTNKSGDTYVAYVFSEVAGYSKFGSYTGNGSTDGTFVYTGFRPRFMMFKRTDTTSNWVILDTARNIYNPQDLNLYPNLSAAEDDYTGTFPFDSLSNGFKFRANYGNVNASGGTYIYMAFCESPFKNALAR